MTTRGGSLAVALVVGSGLMAATAADAGTTYRFEDEAGTVHYTNVPTDPRYRFYRNEPEAGLAGPGGPRLGTTRRSLVAFAESIRAAAERHGVDQRLVEAVILVESAGNPGAVSSKGARGLMQLMPQRAAALGVQNAFDPGENVEGGVRHLRDLLRSFGGNVTLALAAYNAGEGAVRAYQGVPPFPETQDYVRRVRALYEGNASLGAAQTVLAVPQLIYQRVDADGTVTFTNIPPGAGAKTRVR